ncbi:MAG: sugar ABC transporter permease [Lachnospiraceae bacterium]|jgi:putative aldouronate transport system permease protein|nr:sugar ABC transporter permease [Lachnospiraceae bacterium]
MKNNENVKNTNEKTTKVKIKSKKWNRDDTELTLLALPTFIWYILFSFLPMFGVIIAFKRYQIYPGKSFLYNIIHSEWVGFENFEYLIKSKSLFILLRNTIGYNLLFIILGIVVPVTLAVMISLVYSKRKSKVYQTAMFFPHFLSWVVVSYFVFAFLSYDKGIINMILVSLGKEKIQWYMEGKYWPFILVFMNLWKTAGYSTVVYLASITGIDPSLYEAAVVDGATKWQQVKNITLPSLKPIVIMMFILNTGRIFYSDFGLFYQVTKGIPASLYNVSSTIDTYVYNALLSNTPIGMTSAATVFQSVACCITILIANWVVKKIDNDYAII